MNKDASLDLDNLAVATDMDSTYLGDREVVVDILRGVSADYLKAVGDPNFGQRVWDSFKKPTDILLGRDKTGATPVAGWNAPDGGIVRQVSKRFGIVADPDTVIRAALHYYVQEIAKAITAADNGEDYQTIVDAAMSLVADTFVGIDELSHPY